jgi:hypothetical protein
MKKGERIPDMQHSRTGAAFCRSLCSDSWRLYSGLVICILQMHTVLQILLETVLQQHIKNYKCKQLASD